MDYKPPINIFEKRLITEIENGVYKAVQELGIRVYKDELLQALEYDRDQYIAGYTNGKSVATKEILDDINELLERYTPSDTEGAMLHAALFMLTKSYRAS